MKQHLLSLFAASLILLSAGCYSEEQPTPSGNYSTLRFEFPQGDNPWDYDAEKIRKVYHGLWRIEESFRIMKSDFDARPIYLNKREHIRSHFLICFVSLVILRLIQNGMGQDRLSVERIAEALRRANCLLERGGYVRLLDVGGKIRYEERLDRKSGKMVPGLKFSSEDQVALDYRRIQETFGTNFYYAYAKQEDFKRFLKEMELSKRA